MVSEQIGEATERLPALGLFTDMKSDTTRCYAVQDEVWVHGPGKDLREVCCS